MYCEAHVWWIMSIVWKKMMFLCSTNSKHPKDHDHYEVRDDFCSESWSSDLKFPFSFGSSGIHRKLFRCRCISSGLKWLGKIPHLCPLHCVVHVSQRDDDVPELIHHIVVLRHHLFRCRSHFDGIGDLADTFSEHDRNGMHVLARGGKYNSKFSRITCGTSSSTSLLSSGRIFTLAQ